MLPLARQARYLGRYQQIARVLASHGFGYLLTRIGLHQLLSLPRRTLRDATIDTPLRGAERLRLALIELGPTFVKFGQLLSTRPDLLPPDFIFELSKLQNTVPPFPSKEAVQRIEAELQRPLTELFAAFEYEPMAAASLGQVHGAVLHTGEHVVIKIQRPNIASSMLTDLAIISDLAALAQENNLFGQQYDLVELAWEFSASLRDELDYRREGYNTDRMRHHFAHNDLTRIPRVYWDYTTSHILTLERLYGIKIDNVAAIDALGINRKRLAERSLELVVEEVYSFGFFHADPHPGNIFALPGEVIGAVDFGQVGVLDRDLRRNSLLLMLAMINHNIDGALRALVDLGVLERHQITPGLRRDITRFINRYVDRPLQDLSVHTLGNDLLEVLHRHRLRLPSPAALLLKALVTMEGTAKLLAPDMDIFAVARPYLYRAAADLLGPAELAGQAFGKLRDVGEATTAIPLHLDAILYQLNRGELRIRTRDEEARRMASAIVGAANRLALALVLAALILASSVLIIAVVLGAWTGTWPIVLGIISAAAIVFTSFLLIVALVRSDGR
ncbi:MAG: AarF/ABC1/UbiB kinase family protein [Chloroflexaceae bacterium]|nr:AarF/ABC1/UbiB kinase family protein [Chloroflexaceae bacterium]NJO07878.1 AarF/ABC1/UbiB kinase family protein [Chloroflexaceae bacterium]